MNMAEYNVSEGDGVVHVCVEIGNVPAEGLQWDIVVTLTLADGFKGGNFFTIMCFHNTVIFQQCTYG